MKVIICNCGMIIHYDTMLDKSPCVCPVCGEDVGDVEPTELGAIR